MYHYEGIDNPRSMFVEGPYGSGKTHFAITTLKTWLESGVAPEKILILVPQRSLARPLQEALRDPALGPLGDVQILTIGGVMQDLAQVYWPLVAEELGFAFPQREPRFLTIETAQYAMSDFVRQAVENGEFDAVNVSPQQIARQVIDNMGKAAMRGISYERVPELLAAAWGKERPSKRLHAYRAAGRVARAYREYCLAHNLLDYALQVEAGRRALARPELRERFLDSRSHLIAEHIEDEPTLTQDLLRDWLPRLRGALLTYETDGGLRVFLGAEPESAYTLRDVCDGVVSLNGSRVMSPAMLALERQLQIGFRRADPQAAPVDTAPGFSFEFHSFYPQMISWVGERIAQLVHGEGVPAREIVILAPYLSDSLRFSLMQRLADQDIRSISHRPSRALREEPAARTLLTLTALVNREWGYTPPRSDVAQALFHAIDGLDPARARLLADVVYRPRSEEALGSFEKIKPEMQARITYSAGEHYEYLRRWLFEYAAAEARPLDYLFSELFGEVLSQPGYGFHRETDSGRVADELVQSARKFRLALFPQGVKKAETLNEVGRRYFTIVQQGLLAALYISSWRDEQADAVFMAPAYTYLMRNRVARVQFWLDVGSTGWWERLEQPLTHPYVLSPAWPEGQVWSESDEYERQQAMLYRVVMGLVRRCQDHIYLGISDLGEQGDEQRGPLLRLFQGILRRQGGAA